jgi:hypothetical protein
VISIFSFLPQFLLSFDSLSHYYLISGLIDHLLVSSNLLPALTTTFVTQFVSLLASINLCSYLLIFYALPIITSISIALSVNQLDIWLFSILSFIYLILYLLRNHVSTYPITSSLLRNFTVSTEPT